MPQILLLEDEPAIADYTHVIERIEVPAWVHFARGVAYGKNGEYDRAAADFERTIAIEPRFGDAYYNRAIAYDLGGDGDTALAAYQDAARALPKRNPRWKEIAKRISELGGKVPPPP